MTAANPGTRHLLIISAHGAAETGTALELKNGDLINLETFSGFFKALPEDVIVYVSACWGGYSATVQAILRPAQCGRPVVIGPLVPISAKHNVELQNVIIDTLRDHDEDYEDTLVSSVKELSRRWSTHYVAENTIRIVTRDGRWEPDQGAGELSAPVSHQRKRSLLVVAVQRVPNDEGELAFATLFDGVEYLQVGAYELSDRAIGDDAYGLVGTAFECRFRISKQAVTLPIHRAYLAGRPRTVKSVPSMLRSYSPPYDHCLHRPSGRTDWRPMPQGTISACRACNWGALRWLQRDGEPEVTALCSRADCPQH